MADNNWKTALDVLSESASDSEGRAGGLNVLKNGERHAEIVREKLLAVFSASVSPLLNKMEKSRHEFEMEIDKIVDSVVLNAKKDGLDYDSEMLDRLVMVNAKVYAIQVELREIHHLLNPNKGN